jgi:Fe-S oxidoreductase
MRALPVLESRRAELETCVFCPKLCRSACPVSNAEPRETITPWGKMSLSWLTAHGDVPVDASHASPAWACTGCFGCRESCDHANPVTETLFDARAALIAHGAGPPAAHRALRRFDHHLVRTRDAARRLARGPTTDPAARDALLVGCAYLRGATPEAAHAIASSAALLGGPVALVDRCCGLPLRLAGAGDAFVHHARSFAESVSDRSRVVVADAGCGLALRRMYPEVGVTVAPAIELLVELAARSISAISTLGAPREPVRWHDPCQLGRGLGLYDAPRAVLGQVLGNAPAEFDDSREGAACSGAGGLLPATMPDTARDIARARVDAHLRAGGGRIVTACASSLAALRRAANGRFAVDDLSTWIARACRSREPRGGADPR